MSDFTLILFTDDAALAARADAAGIDWIGPDVEIIGKRERQGHFDARISGHDPATIAPVRAALKRARGFARTNPVHAGSREEIDALIAGGAQVLMLPMFRTAAEVERFIDLVGGRARVCLLLETGAAAARAHHIFRLPGIERVHVGLNDLGLSLGIGNRFELAVSGLVDMLAHAAREANLAFGFGGLARVDQPGLPVPGDLIYAQYARLGATSALVTRAFLTGEGIDLAREVAACRQRLAEWRAAGAAALERARLELLRLLAGR